MDPRAPARQSPDQVRVWLSGRPSLDELRDAFPADWEVVENELAQAGLSGDASAVRSYLRSLEGEGSRAGTARGVSREERLRRDIRRRMLLAAVEQRLQATAAGVHGDRIAFNFLNGYVAQRLLFARDLERKPVSLFWFRLWWPLLWQRRYLMPLVGPKGIYCFYSRPLIRELSTLIGRRSCLEVAAGDGTLSRLLAARGVSVTATDDHSWSHQVTYPEHVVREEATVSLRTRDAAVVVCSWPPPGNSFERRVFSTRSVELYVMIGSRHEFATGDWNAYRQQSEFEWGVNERLSRLLLPPELEGAVYLFTRKTRSDHRAADPGDSRAENGDA